MNKVLELLEQHCQWIAIALGGLFFVWVAWAYVLMSPVAIEKPNAEALTPGNVDLQVKRNADTLEDKLSSTVVRAPDERAKVEVVEQIGRQFGGQSARPMVVDSSTFGGTPFVPTDVKDAPVGPEIVKVDKLPTLPEAEVLPDNGLKSALAFVMVGPVGVGQPQPANPAGVALPANGVDLNYIRGNYRIDPAAIDAAFKQVNVPPGLSTVIVSIKVLRQEEQADGTWSKAEDVKLLDNGIKAWPIPADNAGFQEVGQFEAWFGSPQGQADLLRPPFYQVLMGEGPWDAADTLDAAKAQLKAIADQERAARAADAAQRNQDRRNTAPVPRNEEFLPEDGPPRGRRFSAPDPSRPNDLAELAGLQLAQAPRNPNLPPDAFFDGMDEMPGDPNFNGMRPGQPGQPAQAGQPNMEALPAPVFVPQGTPTITGWFYDADVKEGRTYRYQVLYAIKNPLYRSNQVTKPQLARQFAIWSQVDKDAWSQPVRVDTSTRYFIADRSWTSSSQPNAVRMEIFKKTGGKWQSRIMSVAIGDPIGWPEAGADWGTGSTLVDVRYDDRLERAYLLLLGPDGKLREREPMSDRSDLNTDRAALQLLTKQAQLPAGASTGVTPQPVAGR